MKEIQLTQGYVALVDDADYEHTNQHKWHALVKRRKNGSIRNVYAVYGARGKGTVYMHRFILGVTDSTIEVDHFPDHNGLNNQRHNLRVATHSENLHNQRIRTDNTSGFKGVFWIKQTQKWNAKIKIDGRFKYLGSFASRVGAARAYDVAAIKYHGDFACTNTMLGLTA